MEEPPDGFNVVIQNLRLFRTDRRQCLFVAFKIWDQHFNRTGWVQPSGLSDRVSKD